MLIKEPTLVSFQVIPLADYYFILTAEAGFTDIKPDNLLANCGVGNARFGDIKLGDFGDSVPQDISTNTGQHIVSAPIYRAPEVMLNVRWTTAVDIWSLGATVSVLIPPRMPAY